MRKTRRQFSAEFKLEAVRLATEGEKPLAQVARELGIRGDMLRAWKRQGQARAGHREADVFPGNGKLVSQDEELRRLRRELAVVREEREILKKAAAFFARESR